ncbi:hypothetical protein MAR_026108 [Mya arenaria]|uniref:Uncharacterized protein n=1 Tax=Mya arenaria TaxID=6604 RepID=A0ABY7EPL7_MYAAR|nr:hypothetical protein MAR_026108 [Mya arenaria]
MVQVTIGRGGQFERPEADVVESFVVDAVCFVRVLDQLVNGQGGISAHAGPGAAAEGMCQLESLQTVAALCFLAYNVKDGVDELSALCVVALSPVVAGAALSEHEVVRSEHLSKRSGPHGIHGAGLEIHKDGTGHVLATSGFIVIDVDSLQLEVRISMQQDNELKLTYGDTVQIETQYRTIDYYNQKIKVIGGDPLQLAELTLDGKLDRIVNKDLSKTKDATGQSLISSVSFSTVDKSTGSVFVPGNNSVVEIKDDGTVELFAYSELLKSPQNIRVLEDSLLVASRENKNVYRVYRSGHVSSVLPTPLDFPVVAIGYDTEERRLFVGGQSNNVHAAMLLPVAREIL